MPSGTPSFSFLSPRKKSRTKRKIQASTSARVQTCRTDRIRLRSFLSYTSGRRIRRAFSCLRFGTRRTGRRRYRYHREETDAVDDARNANTRQMRAPKGTEKRKARMRDKDGAFCAYECTAFARQVVKKISRRLKERNKKEQRN